MGAPRWRRRCLLLLPALAFSAVLYGRCRPAGGGSLLQQEPLLLVPPELSQEAGSHDLTRESIIKRGQPSKYSPELEKPKPTWEQPSSCLQSLTSKVKADSKFGKLFHFRIPVLMWDRHLTPETWNKLKERGVPYGWQGLSYAAIASTLRLLNDSANRWLIDRASFPGDCIRCAVVGNGGILQGSRQGKEIDAHDFVFRLNGAVTKGFEEDVGMKTSFYGFTVNTMKNSLIAYREYGFTRVPQSKELRYIFIPSDRRDYTMLKSAILGSPVEDGPDKGDDNAPAPGGTDSVSSLGNSNNPLYSTAVLKVSTYGNESLIWWPTFTGNPCSFANTRE